MLETQAPARHRHRKGTRNEAAPAARERELSLRAPRRGLVSRPALVGKLTASTDPVLAVVVAPAGYGKSTLLAEWAEHDERTFVRVDLDERHAGSTELTVGAIIAGFGEAGLIQPETRAALTSLVSLGPAAVLSALLGCICDQRGFVIALDDAHVLPAARSREVVGAILKDLPEGSLLAVASRTEPPLPVARLRAQRMLVEIRTGDLAMTPADAASLLRKARIELDFAAVQALVRRTEGWPAAIYLAALSLREDPELAADFSRYGGDDHLLSDFLRDEVLSTVPAELRDFALRTAVLEELSGPLCDEVLEQRGSGAALATLERLSQLLVPLDATHETFRWQRLLRDALRAELVRTAPDVHAELDLRASAWYARQGEVDRAIDHASSAGDARLTGELLWSNILAYVSHGRAGRVECWVSNFSDDAVGGSVSLALSRALGALASGDLDRAQQWTFAARSAVGQRAVPRRPRSLKAGMAVLETFVVRRGASQMRDAAAEAYTLEPDDSAWHPVLCLMRGVSEHLVGERETARRFLDEGAYRSGVSAPMVAALCQSVSAMIAIEQKDWDLAEELADDAVSVVEERGLADCPTLALVFAASAAARARQDRADEAKRDLRHGVELLGALGDFIPWYGAEARVLLAHASLSLADAVRARTLLAEASRLARRTPEAVIFKHWFDEAWAYMDTLAESVLAGPSTLTIAELRILRFLPSHRSFREIGSQLGVSANTVKTQAHAVYRKLGAASRSEAVARAAEAGLIGQ
jgi:LuxR family transcriptional regulator, maltose regulon positive regulatory protein